MPRIILPSVACLALLYFTAARQTPSLEEGQLPAVRDCLMQFPSHSVLNVNHTMETMSVCLSVCQSVLTFKLENILKFDACIALLLEPTPIWNI